MSTMTFENEATVAMVIDTFDLPRLVELTVTRDGESVTHFADLTGYHFQDIDNGLVLHFAHEELAWHRITTLGI